MSWPGGGAGSGGVGIGGNLGPNDNVVPRSDGTGGATLQPSPLVIDDAGKASGITFDDPTAAKQPANKEYVDAGAAATLAAANGHADAGDAATLASADAHADAGDAATLASADAHADAGDAATLAAAETYTDQRILLVEVATTGPLPAFAYANGTGGQGATITATSNGALAAVSGVTLHTGDLFFLQNAPNPAHNGPYKLLQGTGGTPWVGTRASGVDTSSTIWRSKIRVAHGTTAGEEWTYIQRTAPVIGTDALYWSYTGPTNPNVAIDEFFDFDTPIASVANGAVVPYTNLLGTVATGGSIAQVANNASSQGQLEVSGGTTAGGISGIGGSSGVPPIFLAANQRLLVRGKASLPALSDATNTFRVIFGVTSSGVAALGTDAIILDANGPTNANWLATTRAGSTQVPIDTGVALGNSDVRLVLDYEPGSGQVDFYIQGVLVATQTVNIPLGVGLTVTLAIICSAGASAGRKYRVDYLHLRREWPERRG